MTAFWVHPGRSKASVQDSTHTKTATQNGDSIVNITLTGDIMPGTLYPAPGFLPPKDGKTIFDSVTRYLNQADLTLGNLETVLLDDALPVKKYCIDSLKCYAFRSPTRYGALLKKAGFGFLNLANNHTNDFGTPGITATQKTLDSLGIHYSGTKKKPYTIFTVKGLKIGVCSFSHNSHTPDVRNISDAVAIVSKVDSLCDILIVSMHIGAEAPTDARLTFTNEEFFEEKRGNPDAFAKAVIDAGADLVWGHGPHIPRSVNLYKNRFVAYSLGNFFTYAGISISGKNGLAPILTLQLTNKGEFTGGRIISCRQSRNRFVTPDSTRAALKEISRLSAIDFPGSNLVISPEGVLQLK